LFNPLNVQLNPICHLLALLGAHHILHVSRIRAKLAGLEETLLIIEVNYDIHASAALSRAIVHPATITDWNA
jgi:hypothetical protein